MRTAGLALVALVAASGAATPQDRATTDTDPIAALIDRHVEARWKELDLKPAAAATDAVFVRRVALDVLGRLPKPQEIDDYVKSKSPDKKAKLVDTWLASDEAAEYFTDRWIRLLFGYSFEQADPLKVDFPAFAGFLKKAYADDTPHDKFAGALVGARGEKDQTPEVNFLLKYIDPKEPPIGLTVRTARVFLGVQIQCAQCHDHPFDKYTQDDFWGLTAFFSGIKPKTRQTFDGIRTKIIQENPIAKMPVSDDKTIDMGPKFLDGREPEKDEPPGKALARFLVEAKNAQFGKAAVNRIWAHFMGRGFVEPIDRFTDKAKASHPALLADLAEEFARGGYKTRRVARGILLSRAYGLSSTRVKNAPDDAFAFKLLKPLDPPQFLNNLVNLLRLDVFLDQFYKQFAEAVKALPGYGNERVFRMYLFQFTSAILAPSGRAPEETPYAGSTRLALKMMNGTDLQNLVKANWGVLAEILKDEKDAPARVERIFQTILSRGPDGEEKSRYLAYIKRKKDAPSAYEDVYWTLINSTEFFFNH
jgi:hypothetical protein